MLITRRHWLSLASASAFAWFVSPCLATEGEGKDRAALESRVIRFIHEYEQQGFHRTGTAVDRLSGNWLCEEVKRAGLKPTREPFPLNRVDPIASSLVVGDRRVEGLPLFDGAFTDASGVRGRIGPLDSDAEIGLTEAATNTVEAGALGDARRKNRHRAIVCITRGGRPGLCPNNADSFLQPFGPPVLQVSSEDAPWLGEQAKQGAEVRIIAQVKWTPARAFNVTAKLKGLDSTLPPLVIMTPRSGWYSCASERGGGMFCWVELMRSLRAVRLKRDVLFVASTGHEVSYLGIKAFVEQRPGILSNSAGWMHLGANLGAAAISETSVGASHRTSGNILQASDDDFETVLASAMTAAGLDIQRRNPRGYVPGGEAEVVHHGGARYVSVIGSNALFHNPDDRGPQAVDAAVIARFVQAFTAVAKTLAGA
jgi:hypothetical protein